MGLNHFNHQTGIVLSIRHRSKKSLPLETDGDGSALLHRLNGTQCLAVAETLEAGCFKDGTFQYKIKALSTAAEERRSQRSLENSHSCTSSK